MEETKSTSLVQFLDEFVSRFDEAHESFYNRKDEPYRKFHEGPCIYFHQRTIKLYRVHRKREKFSYTQLLNDIRILEYLYATLTAWGMNSLRGGPQLKDFTGFKKALQTPRLIALLEDIKDITLLDVSKKDLNVLKEKMVGIFSLFQREAKMMRTRKILIGSSKTLHHLHPDLFMPIDQVHTIALLKKHMYIPSKFDNFKTWWNIFLCSWYIAKKKGDFSSFTEKMDTSIPKIIDNAIVGYEGLQRIKEHKNKLFI